MYAVSVNLKTVTVRFGLSKAFFKPLVNIIIIMHQGSTCVLLLLLRLRVEC